MSVLVTRYKSFFFFQSKFSKFFRNNFEDWSDNIYGSMYVKNDYGSFGINGFGDRFIPFRKKTGSSYQYGYLKLNLSADADNLIIKSIAYCDVPDKTIYFGDY